ncbi:MAG: CAP domain-containing protein [Bacteroidota bacterium]
MKFSSANWLGLPLALWLLAGFTPRQEAGLPKAAQAESLFSLINDYRLSLALPAIPYSASLTKVAAAHVKELSQRGFSGESLHSWADCQFSPENPACMWEKPRQLTGYPGAGYEIAQYNGYGASPGDALKGWIESESHHAMMINQGMWAKHPWQAIGVAMEGKFACVWFGEVPDRQENPDP